MNTSTTITKISAALLAAQKIMGDAVKGSKNPFFKSSYADLNSIREAVTPALNENGITVMQPISMECVETVLLHESGEFMSSQTPIVCAKQNDPQALGSAISYARRYGLQAMLNVGAVDDDGEKAVDRSPKSPVVAALTATTVLAQAQAVVARKKASKEELLKFLGNPADNLTDAVNELGLNMLEKFNTHLKGLMK